METIAILKKIIIQNLISSWTFCNWDCYKQPTFFFSPSVCLAYLAALSVQAIVLLRANNAYLQISPNWLAALWDLDELLSQTQQEAANQQQQSCTQRAAMSKHVRKQKGNGWAQARLAWLEQQSLQTTLRKEPTTIKTLVGLTVPFCKGVVSGQLT